MALAAWKQAGEHFLINEFHIACSGIGPAASLSEWIDLAKEAMWAIPPLGREPVRNGLANLHHLFSQAPELGSLIDPKLLPGNLFVADFETLEPVLSAVMKGERKDEDAHERAVAAQGMAKAAQILSGEYTLVITNVPYLGRGKQSPALQAWADENEPDAKADLATMFISRAVKWLTNGGTLSIVSPQNWMFLTTYKHLRERILTDNSFRFAASLGEEAWRTFGNRGPRTVLTAFDRNSDRENTFVVLDVSTNRGDRIIQIDEKIAMLRGDVGIGIGRLSQWEQLKNPDARIRFSASEGDVTLAAFADSFQGIGTSDNSQFLQCFWEVAKPTSDHRFVHVAPEKTTPASGMTHLLLWEGGTGRYYEHAMRLKAVGRLGGWKSGAEAWDRLGIAAAVTGRPNFSDYLGTMFDTTLAAIIPKVIANYAAIYAFLTSDGYLNLVRAGDQSLSITEHSFLKVPFDLAHWEAVAAEKYPNGLPEPESDDPTQWLFHGRPEESEQPLEVAVARLLGYRWPGEWDEKMRLSPGARELVKSCDELLKFTDDDGVVPLVAINTEQPGDQRVRALLEAAYGDKWTPGLLNDLLTNAGSAGKSLEEWLRNDFFAQHCSLFHQRPFIWQIWDGKKDGFNILVNYHRLAAGNGEGKKLLEKIVYTYLGDWITQQQAGAKQGVVGADTRLKAAQDLHKKLEAIITGEPPFDIFVRWKLLHEQPIGWNPDINDGVRMNIRPFITANVLRSKVNVKWTKDRGKEPASIRPKNKFPWFWKCPEENPPTDFAGGAEFSGERLNNLHYTIKAKQAARESVSSISPGLRPGDPAKGRG